MDRTLLKEADSRELGLSGLFCGDNLLEGWGLGWKPRRFLLGLLPLLFLLVSCGGGGGSGGQGILSVELAFTPGDEQGTVNLVEKGPLVRLLNISTYQLTAIDSADETMRIEGARLTEGAFNGSTLSGLMNDRNYTFSLRVFYFPVGSTELSNLSLRIDYISANAENIKDAGGITIGINTDDDYLADLVDKDDDNDMVADTEDLGEFNGRQCRLSADCDGDGLVDSEDLGEFNGRQCRLSADCDGDGLVDSEDLGEFNGELCRVRPDCDGDNIVDEEDSGEFMETKCYLSADCDKDGTLDSDDLGEFNGVPCRVKPDDCDDDTIADELDVDIDGDGLIEIGTAAELDAVRYQLTGSGRRLSEGATLDRTGCGNGADITACNGYELVRDISLAAYAGGEGWAPLGRDTDSGMAGCQGTSFSGVFEGNGWTVRDMSISRSGEDCIGLFGHLAAGTVIRNLAVRAEAVIGKTGVGGLAGSGSDAEIVSSSSVAGEISGSDDFVGGLVGWGSDAKIVSSSSVAGEVSGDSEVGGLVGRGEGAEIVSSYSVAGEVSGNSNVGGLVGWSTSVEIVSSYSVAGEVSGGSSVGGLVGSDGSVDSSYWYSTVRVADNNKGVSKTLAELRTPTNDNAYDSGSIYANWGDGADIDDTAGVEDITKYCDEDLSGVIEAAEMRDGSVVGENDNRIWDFGETEDYPAIRCLPLSLAEQRSWWFINSTGHPNVNQTRLDMPAP